MENAADHIALIADLSTRGKVSASHGRRPAQHLALSFLHPLHRPPPPPPAAMNNIAQVCLSPHPRRLSRAHGACLAQGVQEAQNKAPQDLRNVVDFLRSSKAGIKVRVGALNGKRTDYFKGELARSPPLRVILIPTPRVLGKSAIKALLSPAYSKVKNVPKIESEDDAQKLLGSIVPFAYYLRVDRGQPASKTSPRALQINQMQLFQPAEYYAWFYEGSQWMTYLGGVAMLAVMLAGVMFPLWPPIMRLGVWYLSIGVLGLIGLFFAIAIVRLIFYIITIIVASPGIWIFPKLFADVGFVSSRFPFGLSW